MKVAKIIQGNNGVIQLSVSGVIQKCPFCPPVFIPGKLGNMQQIERLCTNECPHFDYLENSGIIITCSGKDIAFMIEKKMEIKHSGL